MKRKKPPVALISVLVLSILGLVIVGKSFSFFNMSMAEQQAQLQKEAAERAQASAPPPSDDTKKPDSEAVKEMKEKMKVGTPRATSPASIADPESKHYKTAVPTVVMPDDVKKPTPNSAAPSGQWYDKQ